jgi:Rap1a immunity proteins
LEETLKHLKSLLLVVLSVVVLPALARAQTAFYGAGDMVEKCKSDASGPVSACAGFLMGVVDTMDSIESQFGKSSPLLPVCAPTNVKARELADVFVKYVQDKPIREHLSAASVAVGAFQDAYPCGGAK